MRVDRRKLRMLRPLMLILVLGLFAAGCPAGTDTEADIDPEAADATADVAEDVEETEFVMEAPDTPGEDIELEFWTFVDAHAEFMIAQAEQFNEENEQYNIILDATSISFEEMHDRTLIALQAGVGAPDLVDLEIQRFATFTRGEVPLQPLTEVVDPYREDLVTERLAPYEVEGTTYGIDYHLGAFVMYYNTAILEEAGVDVDDIVTWDDYIEAGQQVVENTDALMTSIEAQDRFSTLALMLQNGGGLYDENNQSIIDSPENVEAVQLVHDMVHEHGIAEPVHPNHHDAAYYEAFNNGAYASVWMPQWYMIRFTDFMPDTEGNLVVRPLPVFEEGGMVSTMGGGTGTAITNQIDDAKLDAAMQFLGYAKLTNDAQVRIWTELGFDPFRDDVYDDEELQVADPFFSDEQVLLTIRDMFDQLAPEYTGPRYPESINALNELVIFPVLEEGAPVEDALGAAQAEIDAFPDE